MRGNPNINYRYLIKPSKVLEWETSLVSFKPKRSKHFQEMGCEDTKKVIGNGEKTSFEALGQEIN